MKPVIVHVCRDIEYPGGVEVFLASFLSYNKEFMHMLVCTAGQPGGHRAETLRAAGVEVSYVRGSVTERRRQLQSIIDAVHRPILHCHLHRPERIGSMVQRCRAKITTKYCTYASDSQVGSGLRGALRRAVDNTLLDRFVTRAFDDVVVISDELEKKWNGAGRRVHRIPVSHITEFAAPPGPRVLGKRPVLMAAARMVEEKCHDLLIDALAHMTYEKVYVLGDGPTRPRVEERIRARKLADIYLTGTISQEMVIEYMDSADILLLTSRTEGLPLLIQEAMSRGLIVVATDVGGNSELLDECSGVLVREATPQALAHAVAQLIGRDVGAMGRKAIERCRGSFSLEATSAALSRIYERMIEYTET